MNKQLLNFNKFYFITEMDMVLVALNIHLL